MERKLHPELPYACIIYENEDPVYVLPPPVFTNEDPLFEDKLQPIEDEL